MAQVTKQVDPDTLDAGEVGVVVVVAVFAAIADHFWSLVDVLLVIVGCTWFLYMMTGLANAMVKAYVKGGWTAAVEAIDDRKMVEGAGRGIGLAAAIILSAFAELVQIEAIGAYMPVVVPLLGAAFAFFAFKISGHITGLWRELGKFVEEAMSRVLPHNRRKDDKDEGDGT